jgi:hypothetical protein
LAWIKLHFNSGCLFLNEKDNKIAKHLIFYLFILKWMVIKFVLIQTELRGRACGRSILRPLLWAEDGRLITIPNGNIWQGIFGGNG